MPVVLARAFFIAKPCFRRGVDPLAAQELLGQSSITTTMRCTYFAPKHAARHIIEAQRLEAAELAHEKQTNDQAEENRGSGSADPLPKPPGTVLVHKFCGFNARDGGRTRTPLAGLRILSPVRLPVPPPRRVCSQ